MWDSGRLALLYDDGILIKKQSFSSDPSEQSLCSSHLLLIEIQCPESHVNCVGKVHVDRATACLTYTNMCKTCIFYISPKHYI